MRSPGWASLVLMCEVTEYCIADECGSETPAWAHDHIVRPEQSNPTLGSAAPHTYGVSITEYAAWIATCAFGFGAGGGPGTLPTTTLPPPDAAASAAALRAATASRYLRCSSAYRDFCCAIAEPIFAFLLARSARIALRSASVCRSCSAVQRASCCACSAVVARSDRACAMLPMNSSRSEKSASELESKSVATCEPNPSYARAASALSAASARFASAWACSASALVSFRLVWTCWSLIWA